MDTVHPALVVLAPTEGSFRSLGVMGLDGFVIERRADPRSRTRHTVEDGQPATYHEQVSSPLILAESARDPSYPVPVPFGRW